MSIGSIYDLGEEYSPKKDISQKAKDGEIINRDSERRYHANGTGELLIGEDYAILSGDKDCAVAIGMGGVAIKGKTHLTAPPSEIRVNTFWVLNEELLTTIPSTLFNPVQTLIYDPPPYADKAKRFVQLMEKFGI